MPTREPFSPLSFYSGSPADSLETPRVLISPHRYIQGKDTLGRLGQLISIIPSHRPSVLMTAGGKRRFGRLIDESLAKAGVESNAIEFNGECSYEEVERIADVIQKLERPADSVIAIGGGKCIDTGKCVAFRLNLPAVICPTIASTDAPCSAVSIMYTPDGIGKGPEFFPNNPAMVVVDTRIIAAAPLRHFISGMGDALATFYEARTCFQNPAGRSIAGGRMTIAALALAELCAKTVYADGKRAVEAIRRGEIDDSVERIVEANTLLSGVGFESGGLAAAHAIAAGLTVIPVLHRDFLHGELVGISLIAHLIMENHLDEALQAARFLAEVGLPVRLEQLQLDIHRDEKAIWEAMIAASKEPIIHNEPFEVTPQKLMSSFCAADRLSSGLADN